MIATPGVQVIVPLCSSWERFKFRDYKGRIWSNEEVMEVEEVIEVD